jgi:hypothetical protein
MAENQNPKAPATDYPKVAESKPVNIKLTHKKSQLTEDFLESARLVKPDVSECRVRSAEASPEGRMLMGADWAGPENFSEKRSQTWTLDQKFRASDGDICKFCSDLAEVHKARSGGSTGQL